jgi:hypothetical protein
MRSVRIAIWTSAEPVSFSERPKRSIRTFYFSCVTLICGG